MINLKDMDISKINMEKSMEKLVEWAATSGFKLVVGVIAISIGFKLIKRFVNSLIVFLEKREVDITLRKFLKSLITGGLKIVLIITVLSYWGVQLASITALVASAGVAVGLALQGSLSNFAGGFIILLLRPFKVGHYIAAAGYEGCVEKIDLFYTYLVTIDNKEVLIPNGTLSNGSLINYSAKEERRVDMIFGVSYDADIRHVKRVLEEIVSKHELILQDPKPFIGVVKHGDSSVDFAVRVWCKTENYWKINFDLLEEVKLRFDDEKINIPYPQMDIHLNKIQ